MKKGAKGKRTLRDYFSSKRGKDLIFCLIILAIPAIQFSLFYIGVNFKSILMAFQSYEIDSVTERGIYQFNNFNNFKTIWLELTEGKTFLLALRNSLIIFLINVLIGITLSLVFSLYIYKKRTGYKVYKVLLFLPSVLSSIVTVTMFRFFVEGGAPALFESMEGVGFLSNPKMRFGTLIFFNIWIGFGTQMLMYSGAMNGIDTDILEAAKLDGVTPFREFINIILPLIFPTISTFLIVNVAGMFTNQFSLYAFYANGADPSVQTVGYYLFRAVNVSSLAEYPVLATYGVLLTLVTLPLTLLARFLLERFGPSVE